jgi:hypothetical protein
VWLLMMICWWYEETSATWGPASAPQLIGSLLSVVLLLLSLRIGQEVTDVV